MADFLTVDLTNVIKQPTTPTPMNSATANGAVGAEKTKNATIDWMTELKNRIRANRALSGEAQRPDAKIEQEFFVEYFNAEFEKDIAEELLAIGEPLQKLLKVLGFKASKNPVLAFLKQKTVQNMLIRTGLINANTFQAIYIAKARKLVVDTDFERPNDYNIIYCPDLYKKRLPEIIAYLELQSKILVNTATEYDEETQIKNKKIFIYINQIKEQEVGKRTAALKAYDNTKISSTSTRSARTVLNNLKLAQGIAARWGIAGAEKTAVAEAEQNNIVNELQTPEEIMAALQFLSIVSDNAAATKAAFDLSTANIDNIKYQAAIKKVKKIMPKGTIREADATTLVHKLVATYNNK